MGSIGFNERLYCLSLEWVIWMNEVIDEVAMKNRPHVVILGAGASCAALPNGDKNGKKITGMNGFIDNFGLSLLLEQAHVRTDSGNLEDIYMELYDRSATEEICQKSGGSWRKRSSGKCVAIAYQTLPQFMTFW